MKPAANNSERIGRFELVRELGRGAQGSVFLARDTHLGREVALKTMSIDHYDPAQRSELVRMLLDEARIVSRLQHPNLVTLYDAGEHAGAPYLVFEYVEGRTLAQFLREEGPLAPPSAVTIALGALRGLACAHGMHVLHRDIKPGNIMLTQGNVPRIMDFGIASHAASAPEAEDTLTGTPSYMAPEYIEGGGFQAASDVFAMGVVLYEMLTGRPPVKGANPQATLDMIVRQTFEPPSRVNSRVDDRLDALVMKALAKNPAERFANAERMAEALDEYVVPVATGEADTPGGTLEFLLRRMRHKGDFPALSNTVSAINRVTASESEPVSALCNAILKDVSLTGKLLKLVNTAGYKQFGGQISTVSRAIGILGFDNVRNIAATVLLFDHLKDHAQATVLKEEVAACYFSGTLARELVVKLGVKNAEEAFICAMFQRLGRLLVAFYLQEEKEAIERLAKAREWDEARAAREVLGLGYEDIGIGVARHWNFPESILASMRPVTDKQVDRAGFQADTLRVIAGLASETCETVCAGSPKERSARLEALSRKYGRGVGVSESGVREVVQNSFTALERDGVMLGASAVIAPLLARAKDWRKPDERVPAGAALAADAAEEVTRLLGSSGGIQADEATQRLETDGHTAVENRGAVLLAGIQDISNVLAGDFKLSEVLHIILETMIRAVGFRRVLLCVRDPQRNALRARIGLGDGADVIVKSGFAVPLQSAADIFFAATSKGADLCIDDLDAENIRAYVPAWYRKAITARGVMLFPLMIKGRAVGIIYGDTDRAGGFAFTADELSLMRTLRNQAVLALKQGA